MKHPIADNRRLLIMYGLFWTILALMHGTFLYRFYDASPWLSVADAIIFNMIFAALGLALWYAVRFNEVERNNVSNLLVTHLFTAAVTLGVLMLTGFYILRIYPVIGEHYNEFFSQTFVWRVLTGLFVYLMLVLTYYLFVYYHNFMEKITLEAELKSTAKTAEFNALKHQINPHFLFNSLNSISALTVDDPDKARDMIAKLSDFLRFSISEKAGEMRRFPEEVENMLRYLEIEKVRYGDRLNIIQDISPNCEDAVLPSLILQPVIENAVKHGMKDVVGKMEIGLKAECFHGFLKVQIRNDIKDKKKQIKSGKGIGLQNIAERMKLTYGRSDLVQVSHENGKFVVTLSFPQKVKNSESINH